ncbi:MAG: hypothetical protein IT328_04880 [Caldilineaceae bacterium]|nr:hypothetical protein [Caldilineaceae bacterium]
MSKRIKNAEAAAPVLDLRQFTIDYFAFFNAAVQPLDRRKQGPLEVTLPADLAEHFGKPTLKLGFHQVTPGSELELVAHGSRLFDRMLALLDRRGALTMQALPNRHPSSQELMTAVRPLNASIAGLKMQEQTRSLYLFNWRITYRADDKREELYAVVLDEQGQRVPLLGETHTNGDGLDIEALWQDAQPVPQEQDEEGYLLPPKLPPMTHLVRLAESARKYAIYHADLRCVTHEAEILPRLYQVLNRITTYYGQQIEEVYESHDPTGEKRRALEADLDRKIAEEIENHRLRVQVNLYSYAVIQTPVAVAEINLSDGKRQATLHVARNRYTGSIQRPTCHACDRETTTVALDRNGHLCCDECVSQCGTCQEIVCADCGVAECPFCGKANCEQCGQSCWACGERACAEHVARCPICGDSVCLTCQVECGECGTRQCRSHLRADAVAHADGSHPLICSDCATRCPSCQQYSAQFGVCASSGQRFCTNCLITCGECGRQVGPGFYQRDPSGKAYCLDCLDECPRCGQLTTDTVTCVQCGKEGCKQCMGTCDFCHTTLCADHLTGQSDCKHQLCAEHLATCHIDNAPVCPVCDEPCAICGHYHCEEHAALCRRCGQIYCRSCVHWSGLCNTCGSLEQDATPVKVTGEPWARDPQVAELVAHYRWRRVSNERFYIFVGDSNFFSRAVIVVARGSGGGQIVTARRLGADDRLRDLFGDD